MEKAREFQKNIYFCFIDYAKAFDCVDHNTLENSERDGNTRSSHLPLEKPLCRSGSNSENWTWDNRLVPNRKRSTSRLYHPAYLTYMLEEAQVGINVAGRNISNLRYAEDTTLMAESEELKSLLMKVKKLA